MPRVLEKVKQRVTTRPSNSEVLKELKTCLHENLYMNVHTKIIHKSQKVKITQISIS